MNRLKVHAERIRKLGISGTKLGDLRKVDMEMEFEEDIS